MSIYQDFSTATALPTELNFDPIREPVYHRGVVVPDQFWMINKNTGERLSDKPSGKNHNPVNYSQMWDSFIAGLFESDIDLTNAKIRFNIASRNAAFCADIIFEQYDYRRIVGEATQMKMRIIDSHDMSFKRDIRAMIMRLACTNGMVTVGENLRIKQMHTTYSDPEKLGSVVSEFPTRLENEAHLYKVMMGTPVNKDQAIAFARENVATYRVASGIKVNQKSVEEFARIWNMYDSLGNTGYRLYNVLTHIGTHVTGREGTDLARKQIRIEDRVADIVQRPAFRKLSGLSEVA